MTRGWSHARTGVTEAMIDAYGDWIWEHGTNVQLRHGDPARTLDFAAVAASSSGLSDAQMADRLGLTREQVRAIRVTLEARRYDRRQVNALLDLGGARRFRAEKASWADDRLTYRAEAMDLRAAVRPHPERMRMFVENGWWADDTLTRWIDRDVENAASRRALVSDSAVLNYGELRERSACLAGGLFSHGIRPGDVVAVQLPNSFEFVLTYLAIARIGAVMATLHTPYREAELRALLAHSRARAFIGLERTKDFAPADAIVGFKHSLPDLNFVASVGNSARNAIPFSDLTDCEPLPERVPDPAPADPFLLLFTSGTTGMPKAVPLTYQMILGNARLSAGEYRLDRGDLILSASPYTHLLGLYTLHLALYVGATTLVAPPLSPVELLQTIERLRPSVLFTAPAHLAAMLSQGLLQRADLSCLRRVVVSGSTTPPDLVRAVAGRLRPGAFTHLWGMTELQAGLYTRPDDPLEVVATSVGRPSVGSEVRVCDERGGPLPLGAEGELQIRGSSMFTGYYRNESANQAALSEDGWFRTGDLAVADPNGNYRVTGRIKDIVNRGGIKYNPRDVEELLVQHPAVAQAAIVPYPDPVLGERACCFIVPSGEKVPTLAELCEFLCGSGLAKVKLPERLELLGEMPMTPTRKVIKSQLKAFLTSATAPRT